MPRKVLPRIAAVTAGGSPMTLLVRWDKGEESLVDVSGMIERFRVYEPLRHSPELFGQVRVGEYGTDIMWTDEIDMSADTLWRLAQEQTGATMTADEFRHWRERKAYTLDAIAKALGLSRRMVAYYEQGNRSLWQPEGWNSRAIWPLRYGLSPDAECPRRPSWLAQRCLGIRDLRLEPLPACWWRRIGFGSQPRATNSGGGGGSPTPLIPGCGIGRMSRRPEAFAARLGDRETVDTIRRNGEPAPAVSHCVNSVTAHESNGLVEVLDRLAVLPSLRNSLFGTKSGGACKPRD
jgi:hypothetical protein